MANEERPRSESPRSMEREEVDRKVQITSDASARVGDQNARANRRFLQLAVFATVVVLALVVMFGVIDISQQDHAHDQTFQVLEHVEAAQNPNSPYSKQADAAATVVIDLILTCIETADAQVAAAAQHRPIPPTPKGCPVDPDVTKDG
jgi:hypothetical protein